MNIKDIKTVKKTVSGKIKKSQKQLGSRLDELERTIASFRNKINIRQKTSEKEVERKLSLVSVALRAQARDLHTSVQDSADVLSEHLTGTEKGLREQIKKDRQLSDGRIKGIRQVIETNQGSGINEIAKLRKELSDLRAELRDLNTDTNLARQEDADSLTLLIGSVNKQMDQQKKENENSLAELGNQISELHGLMAESENCQKEDLHNKTADLGKRYELLTQQLEDYNSSMRSDFKKKIAEIINTEESIKNTYATQELLETNFRLLEKNQSDELQKLSSAQEEIKASYATKDLAHKLSDEQNRMNNEKNKKMNEVLLKLRQNFVAEQKKLKKLSESQGLLDTQHKEFAGATNVSISGLSKSAERNYAELTGSIAAETTKLNEVMVNGLQAQKTDFEKSLKDIQQSHDALFKKSQKDTRQFNDSLAETGNQISELYGLFVESANTLEADFKSKLDDSINSTTASFNGQINEMQEDMQKVMQTQEDIRESYATKDLAYKLNNDQNRMSKERDKRLGEALLRLRQKSVEEQKKLKKLSESLGLLNTEYRGFAHAANASISGLSESAERNYVELTGSIAAETTKLNEVMVKELQAHKTDFEKSLKDIRQSWLTIISQHKVELKKQVELVSAKLGGSLEKLKSTTNGEIRATRKSLSSSIDKVRSTESQNTKELKEAADSNQSLIQKYIEKNDSEKSRMQEEFSKSLNYISQELERNISSSIKLTQEKAAQELEKFKDKVGTKVTGETKRVNKNFSDRDKEFKQSTTQLKLTLEHLQTLFNEYKKANESEKSANFRQLNSDINMVANKIFKMQKFEDSLNILNEERINLMSILESFCRIKKDINKVEEEKLLQLNEYMKEKAREFKDTVFNATEINAVQKLKQVEAAEKKKKKKEISTKKKSKAEKPQSSKPLSSIDLAHAQMLKKLGNGKTIVDEIKFLQNEGLTNKDIIKLYNAEYGEHKVSRAVRVLREEEK